MSTDVFTLGETMALLRSETPGPLATQSHMALGLGGAESNFAIALSRLGTSVTWLGRVGADALGQKVTREITAEGVRVVGVTDPEAATGLMIKEARTAETTRVYYYRAGSAGSRLSTADLPLEEIRAARLLHVTGITPGLSATAAEATIAAMTAAREAGVTVSFDLNYRAALWSPETAGEAFRDLIPLADIVFAGDDEAAIAVGEADSVSLAHRIAALGPAQAIIKRGAQGCAALIDGVEYAASAIAITAVDTVGAGDAFVAGYIAELLAGEAPAKRLDTAVRTGAFACLVPGDWEGMPTRSELQLLDATEPVQR